MSFYELLSRYTELSGRLPCAKGQLAPKIFFCLLQAVWPRSPLRYLREIERKVGVTIKKFILQSVSRLALWSTAGGKIFWKELSLTVFSQVLLQTEKNNRYNRKHKLADHIYRMKGCLMK